MAKKVYFTPERIASFLPCPRRGAFQLKGAIDGTWKPPKQRSSLHRAVVERTIKWVYLEIARTGECPRWRNISKAIDRTFRDEVTRRNIGPEELKLSDTTSILATVQHWQNTFLNQNFSPAVANFPLWLKLENQIVYCDTIPLAAIDNEVSLLDFSEEPCIATELFNDPIVQIRIWGWWRYVEDMPVNYYRLVIKPASVDPVRIGVLPDRVERTERVVRHILRGVKDDAYPPASGRECSGCEWASYCSW